MRVTNNIGSVYVEHAERAEGRSNYTLKKLISLYLNMFLNFSIKPLRLFTMTGFVMFLLGIVLSIYFIIDKIIEPGIEMGWTSIIVSILILSGIQLMFSGLIGEYLGKNYLDQNGTPQWVIKKTVRQDHGDNRVSDTLE
jgi:undecaprenyl-phosphate 4-deoxy-4-formamido-L-arabinose transferase